MLAVGYIQTILADSLLYSAHAHPSSSSNPSITLPDLILAIQSHLSHSLIQQPSKSTLLSLANTLNSTPLPPISDRFGLRLPPKEQCLTNVNFRIVPEPLDDPDDDDDDENDAPNGPGTTEDRPAVSPSQQVGDEDAGDDSNLADTTMQEANGASTGSPDANRGVKRSLDEDDEYD